mmetsp:Transcript_102172/g.218773  ORF Transcript_102172/g.218773 Transcript_102172/m.218773 type:complete len:279 (+) Transcript_102172:320-1156(+)
METVHLVLASEDVIVWDLVRGQEGASVHVADDQRRSSGNRLPIHLQAHCGVGVEDLPQSLPAGCSESSHFLVPREFRGGQSGNHLAVHVGIHADLGEGGDHDAKVLPIVEAVISVAVFLICSHELEDVPCTRSAMSTTSEGPSIELLLHGVVGVCSQEALRLVAHDHHLLGEVEAAIRRGGELLRLQRLLELFLLRGDDESARLLLLEVVLQLDLLELDVLTPVPDARSVVELGPSGELLRRELHLSREGLGRLRMGGCEGVRAPPQGGRGPGGTSAS